MRIETQHEAQLKDQKRFERGLFETEEVEEGVKVVKGRALGRKDKEPQSYIFDRKIFTSAEAKEWLREKKISYIRFEAGTGQPSI